MILVLFFLLSVFFIIENYDVKINKKIIFLGFLFLIAFTEAIRVESGTDYLFYFNNFKYIDKDLKVLYNYEPLYSSIAFLFKKITDKFYIFNFFYFTILLLFYYFSFPKVTNKYLTLLFLFFCIIIGYFGSNRQLMALAITFFATVYFLPKEKFYFILWVLVAAMFHYSAIFLFLFLFLNNKIAYKGVFLALILVLILLFTGINTEMTKQLSILSHIRLSYNHYFLEPPKFNFNILILSIFGSIRRLIPILILLYYRRQLQTKKYYNIILNITYCSLLFHIFCINNYPIFSSRLALYLIVYESIVYTWLLDVYNKKYKRVILLIIFAYGLTVFLKGISQYPELFIPYKTIFFNF